MTSFRILRISLFFGDWPLLGQPEIIWQQDCENRHTEIYNHNFIW